MFCVTYYLFIYFRRFKDLSWGQGYNSPPPKMSRGQVPPLKLRHYTRKLSRAHNYSYNH